MVRAALACLPQTLPRKASLKMIVQKGLQAQDLNEPDVVIPCGP